MAFVSTFIAITLGGLINSAYLAYGHYRPTSFVCPLDHDCSVVTESRWSHVFGVRNDVLGMLFFAGMLAGIISTLVLPEFAATIKFLLFLGASFGLLFSVFLSIVQIFAVKDYCFYCIISAVLSFLLFVNALYLYKFAV